MGNRIRESLQFVDRALQLGRSRQHLLFEFLGMGLQHPLGAARFRGIMKNEDDADHHLVRPVNRGRTVLNRPFRTAFRE